MRTIVIGDIHGCYQELKNLYTHLIINKKYRPNKDRLIFLGDYIDRGPDPRKVIKFVRNLQRSYTNVIPLMGNHEDLLLDYYNHVDMSWLLNGYEKTLDSYDGYPEEFEDDKEWMKDLPLYFEDDYYIYVHAGIDVGQPLEEQSKNTLLWIRDDFIYNSAPSDKRIIFGHTPSILFNQDALPYQTYNQSICIDTGCVFGGKLTALIIEDDQIMEFSQIENGDIMVESSQDHLS